MSCNCNVKNAIIAFLVPLPSILFYLSFLNQYNSTISTGVDPSFGSTLWSWCYHHPLLLANVLFFLNVNILFWLIGQIQSSHWVHTKFPLFHHTFTFSFWVSLKLTFLLLVFVQMIDPYWTVIPVMLVHYYATHPLAYYNWWRSKVVIFLTWVWSIRLTHNYFRRENWQLGAREDWRFTEMSQQYGKYWWWVSFFAVYVSQQVCFFLFFWFLFNSWVFLWTPWTCLMNCLFG